MAIWYSDARGDAPLWSMGGGKWLILGENASLCGVRGGYSAPPLLSLLPQIGGYYEVDSRQSADGRQAVHRLFYSDPILEAPTRDLCDLHLTDSLSADGAVFTRRITGLSPIRFVLQFPGYVRATYHADYRLPGGRRNLLFLTIPAGTAYENGVVSGTEHTYALILQGDLTYESDPRRLYFEGEFATLSLLPADDPSDFVKRAGELIMADVFSADEKTETEQPSSPALLALTALQSAAGGILADRRTPYAMVFDLPALTAALLRHERREECTRMLLFWTDAVEHAKSVPGRLLCANDVIAPPAPVDGATAAAYLLAVASYCQRVMPTGKIRARMIRGMRIAARQLYSSLKAGMLTFGTACPAFSRGILPGELLFQGCAEHSALAIAAGRAYLAYDELSAFLNASDRVRVAQMTETVAMSLDANFAGADQYYRNAPRLEALTRRPRFLRWICTNCQSQGAYPAEEWLEADAGGRYLCRRCLADRPKHPPRIDPALRRASVTACASVALLTDSPSACRAVETEALAYMRRTDHPDRLLPMREGEGDLLLILALRKLGKAPPDLEAEICARIQAGNYPSVFADDLPLGARHCATTLALFLLL